MNSLHSAFQRFFVIFVTVSTLGFLNEPGYTDCSQAERMVLSVPDEVADPSTTDISVSGGVAPYSWVACGDGFSVDTLDTDNDNQLGAQGVGCRYGTVTVKDSCGQVARKGVRGTDGGSWVEVTDYNGECVITGDASVDCVGNSKVVIKGQYKLTQTSTSYYGTGSMNTQTYCDVCSSNPPSPEFAFSCFKGWENNCGSCEINWKESEICLIHPNQCSNITYLGTYCYRHVKTLYKWACNDEPSDCELNDNDNLGDCPNE